jgi:hypothetical protein
MRTVAFVLLLTACSSKSTELADAFVPVDAACDPGTVFTPISVTGTSPVGSLDIFHYATAGCATGFCPDAYVIQLTPSQADFTCYGDPHLLLSIYPPFHPSGTHMAYAYIENMHDTMTQQVTFRRPCSTIRPSPRRGSSVTSCRAIRRGRSISRSI